MFTGIVTAIGQIVSVDRRGDLRVQIACPWDPAGIAIGASIACSGVCLTVVRRGGEPGASWFAVDVSAETVSRTSKGMWTEGRELNLEPSLRLGDELGGHIVTGHVDAVGEITLVREDARSIYYEVTAPVEIAKYLAEKGSITVDGISLTINHLRGNILSLNLIPHTAERTNISTWKTGAKVNLEVDVLARYIERLLLGDKAAEQGQQSADISMAFLAENGFLK